MPIRLIVDKSCLDRLQATRWSTVRLTIHDFCNLDFIVVPIYTITQDIQRYSNKRKGGDLHTSLFDWRSGVEGLNKILEKGEGKGFDFSSWRNELDEQKVKFPFSFKMFGEAIPPQYAIQWLTSGGLGAMGFGLPAAIGAAVARPDAVVVDIDGDGSFMMNVQELATICVKNIPVKILLLNNQHMACDIPAARVTKKADLRAAIQKMLDTLGPYLLDVIVPHQEHVLPMILACGGFMDVITEGDGRTQY
ncbi:acetolactate synthase [Tanacetum coccineum]